MGEPGVMSTADEESRAKEAPHLHIPRLVLSRDVGGERVLDRIADVVNRLVGSMWLFVGITVGIVVWLSPATSSGSTRPRGRCFSRSSIFPSCRS